MVFWWTRSGYLALLTTIGVVGVYGAVLTLAFGEQALDNIPWIWAIGYWLAAGVTWVVGSRLNGRPWRWKEGQRSRGRFLYDAPNRFVSLPVETWSIPMAAIGLLLAVRGALPS